MTVFISEFFSAVPSGYPVLTSPITSYTLSSGTGVVLNVNTRSLRVLSDSSATIWAGINTSTVSLASTTALRLSNSALGTESWIAAPSVASTLSRVLQIQTST